MITINETISLSIIKQEYGELYRHCNKIYLENIMSYFSLVDVILEFIEYPNNNVLTTANDVVAFINNNYLDISFKLL